MSETITLELTKNETVEVIIALADARFAAQERGADFTAQVIWKVRQKIHQMLREQEAEHDNA